MRYVLSDIHGSYERFLTFLKYTHFNHEDTAWIIGDLLNRGEMSIPLLKHVMRMENITLLKGNHELMMLPVLNELIGRSMEEQQQIIQEELEIEQIGQEETLSDFCKLSRREQNAITYFLSELPLYDIVEVNGAAYILVHAGLPDFNDSPIEYYDENELMFGPHDFSIDHYGGNTKIVVGHLPTRFLDGAEPDKIYHSHDTIAIDCGCGYGGQLGVLCLDTMEELYF